MDEVTINKIIQTEPISKYFIGVFARNEVPRKMVLYPSCFIFNTQSRDNEGEHWLAVFINKRKKCYFFDSYGLSPQYYHFSAYINSISDSFNWNMKRLQGDSSYCGFYCIAFLHSICRNELNLFYLNFSNDFNKNDLYVKNLLE
jgi:hypothetical protein